MSVHAYKIGALFRKDLKDASKNSSFLLISLLSIFFAVLYRSILPQEEGMEGFVLNMCLALCLSSIPLSSLSMMIAEEKEKHTLRTLMLSNVSAPEFLISKASVVIIITEIVCLAIYAIANEGMVALGTYILVTLLTAVGISLLGAVIGIVAKNQMSTGVFGAPVMLLFLLPSVMAGFNETIGKIARFTPIYAMQQLLTASEKTGLNIAVLVGWIVISAALFTLAYRKRGLD